MLKFFLNFLTAALFCHSRQVLVHNEISYIVSANNQNNCDLIRSLSEKKNNITKRFQEPQFPYPYVDENIEFKNIKANITLSGTLTFKNDTNIKVCVVFAHPSEGNKMNSSRDGEYPNEYHKPFLVLADYLSRENIAVLRFDERGLGHSTGNWTTAKNIDFSDDVLAGIDYFKSRSEFENCTTGIVGHSKGGMTAILAANSSKTVEFLVLLGSPIIDLSDVFLKQYENVYYCLNSSDEINTYKKYSLESYNLVKTISDSKQLTKELLKLELKIYNRTNVIQEDVIEFLNLQWVKDTLLFKSERVLKNIQIPVLGLYGSLDLYVSPTENMDSLNKSLTLAGNTHFKLRIMPNLNHQFQTAVTGHHVEYFSINETIAPEVLTEIANFVNEIPKILNKTES